MPGVGAKPIRNGNVLQAARKVAATIGADFFRAVAHHLAKALPADCVIIGEFIGGHLERVRTLSADLDGKFTVFEYQLAGTAAAEVALGRPWRCSTSAQTRFPLDPVIVQVHAQAGLASPLLSPQREPLGFIMALSRQMLTAPQSHMRLLEIFAVRVASELHRKRVEDRIRESEQRYRAFVASNADGMWRVEFDQPIDVTLPEQDQFDLIYQRGYVAECNDSLARLLGRDDADCLIGARLADFAPLTDASLRQATLLAIRAHYNCTCVEISQLSPDGQRRHLVRTQWGIVEDGKLERIWGTTRDVTDLKYSQRALDASEQRMVNLLENVHLAVVMLNADSLVAFCNRYFYELTGWTAEQVCGHDWIELLVPAEERAGLRATLAGTDAGGESTLHFDSSLSGPDGRVWRFEWDRTMLRDTEDRIAAWALVGRDVTQYKAIQEQLRQSQKLESVGRLAGGVAHNFNNLLTVIMGYSTTLLERRDESDPDFVALTEISNAAKRGAELTGRLLAFSRRHPVHRSPTNLNSVIADIEPTLRYLIGADVSLVIAADPTIATVNIDPSHFQQVLMNLAINARDAMPNGGVLTISTVRKTLGPGDELWATVPAGSYVFVTVSDTGVGMSEEVKSHLFEAFYTTKELGKGTGLGLSTVYGIVRESGGQILVQTTLGKGTVFTIILPTGGTEDASATPLPVTKDRSATGTETVLVVEDQEEVRRLAAAILARLGYNVLETADPSKALEFVRAGHEPIDLLLTDVVMPGMGGFELADLVRAYQVKAKVLFMSGYAASEQLSQRISKSGFGYLQKPFTPTTLGRSVRDILDQR